MIKLKIVSNIKFIYTLQVDSLISYAESQRPEMKDINRYTKSYADSWKDVGVELGLQFDRLGIIEKDYSSDCVACFQATINSWLKLTGDKATWKALEVALTNVNRQKLNLDPVDDVYGMKRFYIRMAIKIIIYKR